MKLGLALALCMRSVWSGEVPAQAAAYPAKPVRVVNPVAAGGNQDIVARSIAEQLTRAAGQQFVVENRPSGSAPAGTPRELLERLRGEVARAVAIPEVRNRYLEFGIELVSSASIDEFAEFLRRQVEEFGRLAKEAGLAAS